MNGDDKAGADVARTMAFLLLRGWLGLRALMAGIEKFSDRVPARQALLDDAGNPDSSGAVVETMQKVYRVSAYHGLPATLETKLATEPLLPEMLLRFFGGALGYLLIALGLMLLLGLWTRISLFGMGVLYTLLTVGLLLLGQDAGVAWLGIHVGLLAFALTQVSYNRFTITRS